MNNGISLDAFDRAMQRLKDRIEKVCQETYRETIIEMIPSIIEDIKRVYSEAADEWYAAYTTHTYKRQRGLDSVLDVGADKENEMAISLTFDDAKMHRGRNGYDLFEKVFVHGWHGGAGKGGEDEGKLKSGPLYYRRPPYFRSWGRKAVQTEAPYDIWTRKKKDLLMGKRSELEVKLQQRVAEKLSK